MAARDQANTALRMLISHLDYASGTQRLMDAKTPALQLGGSIPTVVTGDLNSTGRDQVGGHTDQDGPGGDSDVDNLGQDRDDLVACLAAVRVVVLATEE